MAIIGQGTFTVGATVTTQLIQIPSGVDWMRVYNYTQAGTDGAANTGVNYLWQRGMTAGTGIVQYKTVAGGAALSEDTLLTGGFTLLDTSATSPGNAVALTAITAANPPVVSTASTAGLAAGSVVRLVNLDNQPQLGGMDFTIDTIVANTSFNLANMVLLNSTASTSGSYRLIPFDSIYYPRKRFVTYVRSAAQAVIYLSVTHEFTVGQSVRLSFPGGAAVWGNYAALDGVQATITAVNVARAGAEPTAAGTDNNIQVDVDTSALGAWAVFGAGGNEAYPPSTAVPFTPAAVVPQGEDTAESITSGLAQAPLDYSGNIVVGTQPGLLADATQNLAYLGMQLGTGGNGNALGGAITGPAGSAAADVMYWMAGKSDFGGL